MSITAEKLTSQDEKRSKAKELSRKITEKTIRAGLTHEQIEKDVYEAYLDVKRDRGSGRN